LALTFLLACAGGVYLLAPPSRIMPRPLLILAALLLALLAAAFAPEAWFGAGFRPPFLDHGIHLPGTHSAQPWWSLEDIVFLVATLLWAWSCLEAKLAVGQRQFLLRCYLGALALVALNTLMIGSNFWLTLPPWWQGLGRFANRNQSGDLLLMGGIAAFAQGLGFFPGKKWHGAGWLLLAAFFFAAMVRNGSRAAVVLFALGLLLLFLLTPQSRKRRQITLLALVAMALIGVVIFSGLSGSLAFRFRDLALGREGRLGVYHDAGAMILRAPLWGVGPGNFEGFFNTLRTATAGEIYRTVHPESDWFWMAAEWGLPATLVFALLVAAAFRIYLTKTPFPELTRTSIVIAILFLIHSLVDVGGHRLGTMWSCLYLVGMGAYRAPSLQDIRIPLPLWRGVGALVLAVAALRVQSASLHPWMPTRAAEAAIEAALSRHLPLPQQKELLDRALGWAPLDWLLYYQRAIVCLQTPELAAQSPDDFRRALFLEQNSIKLPLAIEEICRHSDLPEAQVIRRQLLDQANPRDKALFADLYDPTLDTSDHHGVSTLAAGDPGLETSAVVRQSGADFDAWRKNLLTANPTLAGVPPALVRELFSRWVETGDVAEFLRQWPLHPEWQTPGWRAYAQALAKTGRYPEAVTAGLQFLDAPRVPEIGAPSSVEEAVAQYQVNPLDVYYGIRLYFAQKQAGQKDEALQTLAAVAKLPHRPDYVAYLLACNLQAAGQDEAAWQVLEPLLN
jgi:O-antigen ligase/tetratricopeptide (TPR) repeat protein